jgi:hypothetical protein
MRHSRDYYDDNSFDASDIVSPLLGGSSLLGSQTTTANSSRLNKSTVVAKEQQLSAELLSVQEDAPSMFLPEPSTILVSADAARRRLLPRNHCGTLLKKGHKRWRNAGPAALTSWKKRYFVLEGNMLFYFKTRKDFENNLQPCKNRPIVLKKFECLVDSSLDSSWGFQLRRSLGGSSHRDWNLRAPDEESRLEWVRALLTAILLAQK